MPDENRLEHLNDFETLTTTKRTTENQNYNSKKNIGMTLYIIFNGQRVHLIKNEWRNITKIIGKSLKPF